MLVIDASALVEVLTADPDDRPSLASCVRDVEWMVAPDLIDYEVLNVLRTLLQRGDIDTAVAEFSRKAFRELRIIRHAMTDEEPSESGSDVTTSRHTTPRMSPSPRGSTFRW